MRTPLTFWLVDDDKEDLHLFKEALQEISERTQFTASIDCIDLMDILHQSELPDVLFLDINMSKKNGMEFLEEIKQDPKLKDIPVVIYSTSLRKADIDRAFSLGAHFYITKPSTFEDIIEVLSKMLTMDWKYGKPDINNFYL
ncbi:response regulator [Runella sp.]|uniref:response regulator n=1 Tax=Runella sp. TaxID=1960881 RepID=UPI003D0F7927